MRVGISQCINDWWWALTLQLAQAITQITLLWSDVKKAAAVAAQSVHHRRTIGTTATTSTTTARSACLLYY